MPGSSDWNAEPLKYRKRRGRYVRTDRLRLPESAAHAIVAYTKVEPCSCEWFYDWASKRLRNGNTNITDLRDVVREVGELVIRNTVERRTHHRGPMAEFKRALALVLHVREGGEGPMFASWF
jgi:hypothetical protein